LLISDFFGGGGDLVAIRITLEKPIRMLDQNACHTQLEQPKRKWYDLCSYIHEKCVVE
jgi:hypothetical protein